MNDEPRYTMQISPEAQAAKRAVKLREVAMQTLEIIGVSVVSLGAALIEAAYGLLLFGLYLAYLANADSRLTKR